jgi:hypothetical protein
VSRVGSGGSRPASSPSAPSTVRATGAASLNRVEWRLDLDLDLDLGTVIVERRLEQLEVAKESLADAAGHPSGFRVTTHILVDERHLTHQVRLLLVIERLDPETTFAHGHDVEPPVGVAPCPPDERRSAHVRQAAIHGTHLTAVADEHGAEGLGAVDAARHEEAVALLEDVQRQGDTRAQHGVEWE